jgi:hypothetical protein
LDSVVFHVKQRWVWCFLGFHYDSERD